jgi:hypothetical protein
MSDESDALKEGAKALQEVAKATGSAVEGVREAGGWLNRIFGSGIEDSVGLYWSDRIKARRIAAAIYDWGKLILLFRKVEGELRKRRVDVTRIPPPKVVLPLLEHATLEEEDDLHTLWANLLVSGLDPSAEEIERAYVSVLAEMSRRDAEVLRRMFAEWLFWEERKRKRKLQKEEARYSSGIGGLPGHAETSVILLYRLGIILPVHVAVEEYRERRHVEESGSWRDGPYVAGGEVAQVLGDLEVVAMTEFGERFCTAVIGDVTGVYEPPSWAVKGEGGV